MPELPAEPRLKLAVVTCMDARIDVFAALGLRLGDAHVIRNAGGRVTEDVIRSLALSQAWLGTEEIRLVQHTGCALGGRSEEELAAGIEAAAGRRPEFPLLSFQDQGRAVREDVERLRSSPLLARRDRIRGYVYDLADGRLVEVDGQV